VKEMIGNFLLRRLQEAGIRQLFGAPDDDSLANAQIAFPAPNSERNIAA
jgi:TPP-dependent 2-oxoacid decarboxylase